MSIASELNNYRSGLEDAYDAVSDMSGTIPTDRNMNNLDDAIRTIPISSPNDGVLTITQNGTTIQTFSANQATNVTAALTDTTYSDFTGATSSAAGAAGVVPAPAAGDEEKVLMGDGTWSKVGNGNIDWSTVPSTYTECTTTGAQKVPSSGNCKICKIGKIVNLQVNYNYSGTNVFDLTDLGDVIIADIPDGCRPPFNIYGAAMVKCSSSTVGTNQVNQIHLWINNTGALLINNMGNGVLTGINAIRGNLTWFVA